MIATRHRKGTLAYGVAALIVVLGAACAGILAISLQSYLAVAQAEQRLQALAAAEGAVALALAPDVTFPATAAFGKAQVEVQASQPNGEGTESHTILVTVLGKNGEPVLESRHLLRVKADEAGVRTFVSLEDRR